MQMSLAEYILVLRVYPTLLQMARCLLAIASTASTPLWMKSRTIGMVVIYLIYVAFVGGDPNTGTVMN